MIETRSVRGVGELAVEQFDATSQDLLKNVAVGGIMLEATVRSEAGWQWMWGREIPNLVQEPMNSSFVFFGSHT